MSLLAAAGSRACSTNARALRHFYTAHPWMAPDIRERGIDLLAPIWHFMDLTPQGRGDWYANLDYSTKAHAAST